jgi:hypothetical protein
MRSSSRSLAGATAAALAMTLFGCASAPQSAPAEGDVPLWTAGATPDYQLGGAYTPDAGVDLVARDRSEWPAHLLLDRGGSPVFDPDWPDEALLDTSTADRRQGILEIVSPWIRGCAASGFDAVEFDNLDSYTRSDGALVLDDNLALAEMLVDVAHDAGLAAGQKNAAEDASVLQDRAGFDFAVVEECAAYRECAEYTAVYDAHVIDIEYTDQLPRPFEVMCADTDSPASMVLRDRDLRPRGADEHVFQTCPPA